MTIYDPLDKGSSPGIEAKRERRNASIASTWSPESEQLLADIARAEAEGLKISPALTLARAYAQSAQSAHKKTGEK